MASSGTFGAAARDVVRLYEAGTVSGLSEAQMLDRFLVSRDEAAFEGLVARHGPMVLSVCRKTLRDDHLAEDAFQATFLLLAKKARTVRGRDTLGPWLHRVAFRVAVRSAKAETKRKAKETSSPEVVEFAPSKSADDRLAQEGRRLLHEEVAGLPEKYRAPVVLCYLQGQTHDEAAKALKWPIGSVKGRLARARDLLRDRLARRGARHDLRNHRRLPDRRGVRRRPDPLA